MVLSKPCNFVLAVLFVNKLCKSEVHGPLLYTLPNTSEDKCFPKSVPREQVHETIVVHWWLQWKPQVAFDCAWRKKTLQINEKQETLTLRTICTLCSTIAMQHFSFNIYQSINTLLWYRLGSETQAQTLFSWVIYSDNIINKYTCCHIMSIL